MKHGLWMRTIALFLVICLSTSTGIENFAFAAAKANNHSAIDKLLQENQGTSEDKNTQGDKSTKEDKGTPEDKSTGETKSTEESQSSLGEMGSEEINVLKKELDKTVLQLPNGRKKLIYHSGDVRFEQNGTLVDYDPTLIKVNDNLTENNSSLKGYQYENKAGDMKHYMPASLSSKTPILMEYEEYAVSFYPSDLTGNVALEQEKVENIYEHEVTVSNKAAYLSQDKKKEYEYVSENSGVKENIILNSKPDSEILQYRFHLKGMTAKKNSLNEGITFYSKADDEKIIGSIDVPFMNDATEQAYSENIQVDLKSIGQGDYEVTMTLDKSYLEDKSRRYPITIDPTVSWTSSSQVYEPYVIKGSPYTDMNFYDEGVKVFAAGDGKQGIFRTYMKIPTLSETIKGKYIESAKLTFYETGASQKGVELSAYRVSEAWTVSTITWTNRAPYESGAIDTVVTSGVAGSAKTLDFTSYVRNVASSAKTNWGFVLRAAGETQPSPFAQFYNSRYATASKRPKMTIEYYDGPTTPTSASVTPKYIKPGKTVTAKWAGIESKGLNRIEYRVATYDDNAKAEIDPNYVPYSASTKISTKGSGSAVIADSKNWPENTYKFVIRGVDDGGIKGTGKGYIFYVDGTKPKLASASITPASAADKPSKEGRPTITWKDASDKFFKEVEYSVNGAAYKTAGTTASGSFKLPAADFPTEGAYTINVRAEDQAGNVSTAIALKYYLADAGGVLSDYIPTNLKAQTYYGKNLLTFDTSIELPGNISYEIHRGSTADFVPSDSTLVGDKIKTTYWSDISVGNTKDFYYKVKVVKTDKNGLKEPSTAVSASVKGIKITDEELNKRLGIQSYLDYLSFSTPNGSGYVEKSQGNLIYSQNDFELPANQIGLQLTRVYNSQSTSENMLGKGWSDSFHKGLYDLGNGTLVFQDSDGSIHSFQKQPNGSYKSLTTKDFELSTPKTLQTLSEKEQTGLTEKERFHTNFEYSFFGNENNNKRSVEAAQTLVHTYQIVTKGNSVYRFDQSGNLISQTEPNGTFLLYSYDGRGRVSEVTTSGNLKVTLNYFEDAKNVNTLLLKSIILPDGSSVEYEYASGSLKKAVYKGTAKETASYQYLYSDKGMLNQVQDAKGNAYGIEYTDGKVYRLNYPLGDSFTLTYEANSTSVTKKHTNSGEIYKTSIVYEAQTGKLIKKTDAYGKTTEYFYDNANAPYSASSTKREVNYQILDDNGKVHYMTKEAETKSNYDSEENLLSYLDEEGNRTSYTYGTAGTWSEYSSLTVQTVTAEGSLITDAKYEYDTFGNMTQEQDNSSNTLIQNQYDADGNVETSTEKLSGELQSSAISEYNEHGNETVSQFESGSIQDETENEYDSMGRVVKTTDHVNGIIKTFHYDYLGRAAEIITNVDGVTKSEKMVYNENGSLIQKTDEDGVIENYTYDALNRVVSRTITKDSSIEYKKEYGYADVDIYTGIGKDNIQHAYVESEYYKNDQGEYVLSSTKYFNANGNLVREMANGIYTDYTYDSEGRILTVFVIGTNEQHSYNGKLSVYVYDESGKQNSVIYNPTVEGNTFIADPVTSIINRSVYDSLGNEISKTDGNGMKTSYAYDNSSRVTKVFFEDSAGTNYETNISYDIPNGDNTISKRITDAMGHVSVETVDGAGLVKEILDMGDGSERMATSYRYDKKGNLTREIYQNGAYLKHFYNKENLLLRTEYYTEDDDNTLASQYEYDSNNRLSGMIDLRVEGNEENAYHYTFYKYDNFGRLSGYSEFNSAVRPNAVEIDRQYIRYVYDVEDKLTRIWYPQSNDDVKGLLFTYDDNRWLSTVEAVVSKNGNYENKLISRYTYRSDGLVFQIRYNRDFINGSSGGSRILVKTHSYDQFARLTNIQYSDDIRTNQVLESHSYAYDKNSNIIRKESVNNYPKNTNERTHETREYTYDDLGRLTETIITNHKDNENSHVISYEYDKAGNRTAMTVDGAETRYNYNGLNQLTNTIYRVGESYVNNDYSYDANGNQIKVVDGKTGNTTVNEYDPANRLSKTYTQNSGVVSNEQENVYNGDGQRVQKIEGNRKTNYFYQDGSVLYTTDGNNKTSYNYLGIDNTAIATARYTDNVISYYMYNKDLLGSTTNVIDQTGNTILTYEYDDFGVTKRSGDSDFYNEIAYTGSIYDETTGLHYMNARYYNPEDGRFLTQDTYRGEAEKFNTLHLYAYTANNPISYTDPTGHWFETAMDFAALTESANNFFRKKPSFENFGYLAIDTVAIFLPGVPGSYVLKGGKQVTKATIKYGTKKGVKAGSKVAGKVTGTVWDVIKATQPKMFQSTIPKSFELYVAGKKFWINPNATKHMYEYSQKVGSHGKKMIEQQMLTSLYGSVGYLVKKGLVMDKKYIVGPWELIFSAPRNGGKYPVLKHAVFKPKGFK